MTQTIKFGKLRASNDPDHSDTQFGIHYGANHNRRKTYAKAATNRAAFVK